MSRELDVQCARALGWKYHDGWWVHGSEAGETRSRTVLSYSETPIFTSLLEDEIERRDKQAEYTFRLSRIVGVDRTSWDRLDTMQVIPWLLLRATSEHRARAFLEVIKGGGL